MTILTDIPFAADKAALMHKNRIKAESRYALEFEELLEKAQEAARPKAIYRECYIEAKGGDTVTVEGITFKSLTLRKNLEQAGRVFAYIATCGRELDQVPLPPGDILQEYWWDTIKAATLDAARAYLSQHLRHKFALGKTATMSPGSGDGIVWPIRQQRELFALLGDVSGLIGVELTESFLMVPNKTVSGIRFPTEVDFHSCQLCHRENCPSRAAPFDPALWEAMQA
jgi:hypothetical protein